MLEKNLRACGQRKKEICQYVLFLHGYSCKNAPKSVHTSQKTPIHIPIGARFARDIGAAGLFGSQRVPASAEIILRTF